jgi:hypothetical protein
MRRDRLALALALIAAGCTTDVCARSSDCTSGQVCTATGACTIPADASSDAGPGDAGAVATHDAHAPFDDAARDGTPDSVLPKVLDDRHP